MTCPCGGELKTQLHQVKTLKKALEWTPLVRDCDLPIWVEQQTCVGCGRSRHFVYDNQSKKLDSRG